MMQQKRIQRKRTKGWRLPANTVCVTRPGPYGNPFLGEGAMYWFRWWIKHSRMTIGEMEKRVVECNGRYDLPPAVIAVNNSRAVTSDEFIARVKRDLPGKNLACWCHPSRDCHADILLEIANSRLRFTRPKNRIWSAWHSAKENLRSAVRGCHRDRNTDVVCADAETDERL